VYRQSYLPSAVESMLCSPYFIVLNLTYFAAPVAAITAISTATNYIIFCYYR